MNCKKHITNCCCMARVLLSDRDDLMRLWRYLNLCHVCCYCGLTPFYSKDNLFTEFVANYGLVETEGERRLLVACDVDKSSRACRETAV